MIYSDIIKYTFIHYIIQYKKIIILSHFLIKKKSITLNKYQKKWYSKKISLSTIFKLFLLKLFKLSKIFLDVIKNKKIFKYFLSIETSYI